MSDRPQNNSDDQPERGAWHAPRAPQVWRPVAKPEPKAVWRVAALPKAVSTEPGTRGTWHLPSPDDTSFSTEDVLEVSEEKGRAASILAPEDLIAEILKVPDRPAANAPTRPEDFVMQSRPAAPAEVEEEEAERLLAPEDFEMKSAQKPAAETDEEDADLAEDEEAEEETPEVILRPDIGEDDGMGDLAALGEADDGFSMSEYFALAALEQAAQQDAAEADLSQLNPDDLSPAARAALSASQSVPAGEGEESAAEYAARMAREMQESASDAVSGMGMEESAAEYAARMAREAQQADAGPAVSPEDAELARKFIQTRDQVTALRQQYQAGQITYDAMLARMRDNTILDNDNNWWMIGQESNHWYRFDNAANQWVEAQPPVSLDSYDPRLTDTGQLNPEDVIAGSLPYLPDNNEYSDPYTGVDTGFDPYGSSGTPIPRPGQPQNDLDRTMVGGSFLDDTLESAVPTLQNLRAVDATVPINTVPTASFDQGIESPYDRSAPPQYDLSSASTPIFDAERQSERASLMRIVVAAAAIIFVCAIVSAIGGAAFMLSQYNTMVDPYRPAIAALASYEPDFQTARILDANGDLIAELNSRDGGARELVSLDEVSPFLIHAVLSVENRTYYEDPGFSFPAIVRAFLQNLSTGEIESGASTITQQIARNLILRDTEATAGRKLTEILVAMEIANNYTKNEILQLYLNEFFFGNQSYGVEAASEFYFNKPAADVNMAEAAMLSSIIASPAANDPVVNRDQSRRATRNAVRLMLEANCIQFQHGQFASSGQPFCINESIRVPFEGGQAQLVSVNANGTFGGLLALQLAQVETRQYQPRASTVRYPHFVNYIQAQVEAQFGPDALFQRGFTIYTTLIPRVQNTAESALRAQVAALVNNGVNTGAVMVTDPQTGAIRAMVGSPDFSNENIDGQVDNTRTWQQSGSAIKPIVYTGALEGGPNGYLTPSSILWDVASSWNIGGQIYSPVNFSRRFSGPVPVRDALQNSLNVPAVKAYDFIGPERFVDVATRMGLQFLPETPFGLATALGAADVRLIDMMKGFGTIANNGRLSPLYAIERITEGGAGQQLEVPLPDRPAPAQVVSPQIAYLMQNILSDDNARAREFGTNTNLTLARLNIPTQNYVGAKTGTSDGGRDLWTMGFTSNAVVGVWLGTYDNAQTVGVTGFTAASPVWNQVLQSAIAGRTPQAFQNPGGVVQQTICRDTGTIANDNCPSRTTDIALQNQPPPPADQGFVQTISIDSWTGQRANQWCPENVVQQTFASIADPFAVTWLNNTAEGRAFAQRIGLPANLQAPPTQECSQGQTLPSIRINNPTANQTLTGEEIITGQVTAPEFNRFELLYAPAGNPQNFTPLAPASTQQFPNAGSSLFTWDTRTVSNGTYILRLAAYATNGGFIFRDVTVNIANIVPTATPTPLPQPTSVPPQLFTPLPFDTPVPLAPFNEPVDLNPTATATLAF